ncbi:unnamed protein product, partial [Meganyctiphanes norvegica]
QDIDKIGEVTKIRRDGDVAIKFEGSSKSWIMNPKVISKRGVSQGVTSLLNQDDDTETFGVTSLLNQDDDTETFDDITTISSSNVQLPEPSALQSDSLEYDEKTMGEMKESGPESSRFDDESLFEQTLDYESKENENEEDINENEKSDERDDENDKKEKDSKEINDDKEVGNYEDENLNKDDTELEEENLDKTSKDDKNENKDEMEKYSEEETNNNETDKEDADDEEIDKSKDDSKMKETIYKTKEIDLINFNNESIE